MGEQKGRRYNHGVMPRARRWPRFDYLDEFRVDVPTSLLSSSGTNLLAVLARDRGWSCFVDLRIEGEIPVPTKSDTWGSIKALYSGE